MPQYIDETLVSTNSSEIDWPGGRGAFGSQGNFNGATIRLRYQIDGSTFTDVPGSAMGTSDQLRLAA